MKSSNIIFFYATQSFQAWLNGELVYEGPSYQLAVDALIPF